jgi:cell division protein FtsI/penicillin-binding protein 2
MRLVVTDGTATIALKGVKGGPVFGKTGTAEHGTNTPPDTRAWFVGWQGNVAFAVLVEEGRSGAKVAAPLAKAFLMNLRR